MADGSQTKRASTNRAYFTVTQRLFTEAALSTFRYAYENVDTSLHRMEAQIPMITPSDYRYSAERIASYAESQLGKDTERLKAERQRLDQLAEDNGIDLSQLGYAASTDLEVAIHTPASRQYLALIEELDQVIQRIEALRLAQLLSVNERADMISRWTHTVKRYRGKFFTLVSRAEKLAKQNADPAQALEEGQAPGQSTESGDSNSQEASSDEAQASAQEASR